jgi:hypothetical protein
MRRMSTLFGTAVACAAVLIPAGAASARPYAAAGAVAQAVRVSDGYVTTYECQANALKPVLSWRFSCGATDAVYAGQVAVAQGAIAADGPSTVCWSLSSVFFIDGSVQGPMSGCVEPTVVN